MRYAVHGLARDYPICGYVENLEDRRVCIVIEGALDVLDAFLDRLIEIAPGHIQSMDRFQSEASGEFHDFAIRR